MKFFKNKLAVTIVVLSVTFLGLIIYTVGSNSKDPVSSGAGEVLSPLQKIAYEANNKLKNFVDLVLNYSEVKEENKKLKKENAKLESKLIDYQNFEDENSRLREIVKLQEVNSQYDYVGCNIIGFSGGSFLDGYVIDKGLKDGLDKGMVVIQAEGLVGQVTSVGDNWAIVQSIYNQNIAVAVMIGNTRDTVGILRGHKEGKDYYITVDNLPMDSKIKKGDSILTSGLGMVYPKEIRIGEVISVEKDDVKVMKTAIIKPYVDFDKLEELYVIKPKNTREVKYD